MPDKKEEKPAEITAEAIMQKLDAIDKRMIAIEEANKPKEDTKPSPAESVLREVLVNDFPKEKLDSWGLAELTMAWDIKKNFKPAEEKALPDPPKGKSDASTDPNLKGVPSWSRPIMIGDEKNGK